MISGVSIIFDWDMVSRGQSIGHMAQADVVDGYGHKLNEELEYENVRTHYIETRRQPQLNFDERLAAVPTNFIPIILSCDWHPRKREVNSSSVEYCDYTRDSYDKISEEMCFIMGEWGRSHVFGHRVLKPIDLDPRDSSRGWTPKYKKGFIRIKPFALNGPSADEYTLRLERLGADLGRAIGSFLAEKGQGLRR